MIKSYGNKLPDSEKFEYISLRNEDMQFLFNNFSLELKDHNYSEINPGFISRSLFDIGICTRTYHVANFQSVGSDDVALYAIFVLNKSDVCKEFFCFGQT